MPGDDLVPNPDLRSKRAITITAPPIEIWSSFIQPIAAVVGTLCAVALWILELTRIQISDVGELGFISALGPMYFAAVAVLTVSFCGALVCARKSLWLLSVQVVVLIFMLHGTVLIIEPLARFSTAWLHAGFTDYIARTGSTLPRFDARFSWPGFFSLTAMLSKAAGLKSPVIMLRWAPLFFNLLYAVGVFTLAGVATKNARARWLAVWLFVCANWVGQDYFSPQALNYFLALVVLAVALRWFRTSPPIRRARVAVHHAAIKQWRRPLERLPWGFAPDELQAEPASPRTRAKLVAAILVIFAVIVVSHPLTPLIVIVALCTLALARRSGLQTLPILLSVVFVTWISYGALAYWSGHINDLFGNVGQLGTSLNQNVAERVSGSSSRILVQRDRIALTGALGLLALIGIVRRLRAGYGDLTDVILAFVPFLLLAVQSYGGEALLRSVLFALPFLAILGAFALMPTEQRSGWKSLMVVVPVTLVLTFAFVIARYGNDQWDRVNPDEHAALEYLYNNAAPGSVVIPVVSEGLAFGYRDLEKYKPFPQSLRGAVNTPGKAESLLDRPGPASYLVVTRGQQEFGRLFLGLRSHWADELAAKLTATGRYRVVFANRDARVLTRAHDGR